MGKIELIVVIGAEIIMSFKTPIAIFAYNRKNKLECMIQSLIKCNNISGRDVYVFCDAPNLLKDGDIERVQEVIDYLKIVKENKMFSNMTIVRAEKHKGCKKSVIEGINYIFQLYDSVIDIEDDLILAEDFLDYIDDGLEYYRDNMEIWSISAFTAPLRALEKYNKTTFKGERATSWGFGIWKNRWEMVDWEMSFFSEFIENQDVIDKFALWGYDLPIMLRDEAEKISDAWDIITCYTQFENNMYTVFPSKSKSYNTGTVGTHYKGTPILQQELCLDSKKYDISDAIYSKEIADERRSLYMNEEVYKKRKLFSDEEKYRLYYNFMCKWFNEQDDIVEKYLENEGIEKIAIYGAGPIGRALEKRISNNDRIKVQYIIDSNSNIECVSDIPVILPIDNLPKVDAIIITTLLDYYTVKKEIIMDTKFISLCEVIR